MPKKYLVPLTQEERDDLQAMVDKGKTAAYKIKHANILLKADEDGPAWIDEKIAEAFGCHRRTVEDVRKRFVKRGLSGAIERKDPENPPRRRKLDGDAEARLIALACQEDPPEGRSRWTLRLLADELVELGVVDSISHETVRKTLKKTKSSPITDDTG